MATTGAADARQQQEAIMELFEAKQAELVAEARGVAREFGADVLAVAFRPAAAGGGAVAHEFRGIPPAVRVVGKIRRALARDVSGMGMEEVKQHERQLMALRTVVARELQAMEKAKAAAAIAGATKRAPEKQQEGTAGGGDSKIRRTIID